MFDKRKFKARMYEAGLSNIKMAEALGINPATLYRKINKGGDFTRTEMQIIQQTLGLTWADMEAVFFGPQLTETQVTGQLE